MLNEDSLRYICDPDVDPQAKYMYKRVDLWGYTINTLARALGKARSLERMKLFIKPIYAKINPIKNLQYHSAL